MTQRAESKLIHRSNGNAILAKKNAKKDKAVIRATEKKKARRKFRAFSPFRLKAGLIIHATHAAAWHCHGPTLLLGPFGDHGFCGDE